MLQRPCEGSTPPSRPPSCRAMVVVACTALVVPTVARAQSPTVQGSVRDALTGEPVVSALIRLGLTEHYTVSDEEGAFTLAAPGTSGAHTLVVTAPGYATRYQPVEGAAQETVEVLMSPEPIDVGGIEASVMTYRTRMRRRLNALDAPSYTLEGAHLASTTAEDVWDLVGWRHGFHFEGFSDYGCPIATIYGRRGPVSLFIDDRPATLRMLQDHDPRDFAVVEVISFGGQIRAYTQPYLDWMTENEKVAVPFGMIPGFCPPAPPAPGTMKRGRPVPRWTW